MFAALQEAVFISGQSLYDFIMPWAKNLSRTSVGCNGLIHN